MSLFFVLILLGIIQGVSEFLPISSSGHLVLFYDIFNINSNTILLSILFHIATLLSVIIYYRKELIMLAKHPFCPTNRKIILTTIVTCLLVLIIKPIIDKLFNGKYLFLFFIITAILLLISEFIYDKRSIKNRIKNIALPTQDITNLNISYTQSIIIGLTQGIACIPGISRSGSTIAVARLLGVGDQASDYSFLISIPIIIASLVMELTSGGSISAYPIIPLIISMLVCSIVGLFAIKLVKKLTTQNILSLFSYYLITLATILIIISFIN
jgi:undecaprenyl-diphosphatase